MRRLIFGNDLMSPTLSGEKLITLRKYRSDSHDFAKGEIIIGEFKDGLDILLQITADTEKKLFSELTDEEAQGYGYADSENCFNNLKEYYFDLKKSDILAVIRYEVLKVNDVPVVGFNEYAYSEEGE